MQIKTVLIGAKGVGKSSLRSHFSGSKDIASGTAETSSNIQKVQLDLASAMGHKNTVKKIAVEFWEFTGLEKHKKAAPLYCQNSHIIALVFDLTKPQQTLDELTEYMPFLSDLKKNSTPFVLIGMKSNSVFDAAMAHAQIEQFKQRHDIKHYIEADTLEGYSHGLTVSKNGKVTLQDILIETAQAASSPWHNNDRLLTALSTYKKEREKGGYGLGKFSKREKITAATKCMAYLYGANTQKAACSKRDILALQTGKLGGAITTVLSGAKIDLSSLEQTRRTAVNQSNDNAYKNALKQFLSDYIDKRAQSPKNYYFFNFGCSKSDKINAASKLIKHLNGNNSVAFNPKEIDALNDGTLKETITTTLSWFKEAPSFKDFMQEYGANMAENTVQPERFFPRS